MNYLGEDLGGCSVRMDELEAGWLQIGEGMNYLGEDLGGCSVRMDELEAGRLQVSEVGEAGSEYGRA
jgi:hypothetical protein